MTPRTTHRLVRAGFIAAVTLLAGAAQAKPTFSDIVFFGDSVSDSGNVGLLLENVVGIPGASLGIPGQPIDNSYIPSAPFPGAVPAVFSNGPVWTTRLAARLGLSATASLIPGGTNFAFGGARVSKFVEVPSLSDQLGMFLNATGGVASGSALYVVAAVGNDARDALAEIVGGADPVATATAYAGDYANGMGKIVDDLQAAGAKNILVAGTVNLGLAPAVRALDLVAPGASTVAAGVSMAMNAALENRLNGESGVTYLDAFSFLTGLVANPAANGLTNVTDACGGAAAGTNCNRFLFWDGIHGTAKTGNLLANYAYSHLVTTPVPEPETYALMVFGLGVLGWMARRRRAAVA